MEIFDAGLLNGTPNHPRLAWFIKVNDWNLNEYIWVDALDGALLSSINQVTDVLDRQVFDGNNSSTTAPVLARAEGGVASTVPEVNSLYDLSKVFYNFFSAHFSRDSFDAAGASLAGAVRVCKTDPRISCPYTNAFWNGSSVNFGAGFVVEDVVAHELTHAVVDYTAGFINANESGALNESYADIFGETVQLTDPAHTTLSADRWKVGEELNIARVVTRGIGLRNMQNPNAYGHPAFTTDTREGTQYLCTPDDPNNPDDDKGGVHTNSGVGNKAYALLTDGGALNGYTVRGIGITKAAAVHYRALSAYLGSADTYLDNYTALVSACADLVGTEGFTVDDCAQVKNATLAVQMTTKPCTAEVAPAAPLRAPSPTPPAAKLCPAGSSPEFVFSEDFENTTSGNWVNTVASGTSAWIGATLPASLYASGHAQTGFYSLHAN